MPRTVRLGLALAALALVATGCASATVAADVDGVKIDDGQAIALGGIDDSGSRVNGDDFRSALSLLVIQQSLGKAAAADFGLPDYTTPEGRTAFLEQASQSQIDTVGNEIEAGVADGRDPDAVETFVVSQVAISTEVREAILHSDEFLSSLWDDDRDVLAGVCASHILVATEAEAQDVIARIDAGEDFGDVADEVSLDTASAGGVLPCPTPISSLITEFAEAVTDLPVGEVSVPVHTQYGWHVIIVHERRIPDSYEDLLTDPAAYVHPQLVESEFTVWLNDALDQSSISIRSQIGRWSPQSKAIVPPADSP